MMNESGLEPVGRAVLVRMYEADHRNPGSTIVIPDTVREKSSVMEQRAQVVAVGPECWSDEKAPRAAPGDKVIITKFAGYITHGTADGALYRLVNDRDIFCRIVKEKESKDG